MTESGADDRMKELESLVETLGNEIRSTNERIDTIIATELDDHARRIKDLEVANG